MRHPSALALIAVALAATGAAGVCAAQAGLSPDRWGLGLKTQGGAETIVPVVPSFGESLQLWQVIRSFDFSLYGGARELPPFSTGPAEAYGGIAYAFPRGWGSSLEAGYIQESAFAPRRYAVAGQVQTALNGSRRTLSMGIKYRVYDTDFGARGTVGDAWVTNGYTLAPSRPPGASFGPGYQLQFGYQHSVSSSFGFALGRDVETYMSAFDPTGTSRSQLTFTGQHWLTPAWALSYDVLYNDPASPLRLQGLGLRFGVRYRF